MAPKAYIGIKFYPDASNKNMIDAISLAMEKAGYTTVVIHRDLEGFGRKQFTPQELMAQTFRAIDSCQLVVIELSEKGVGLGIEAGYAAARGIPILTIAKEGADISNTLRGISKAVYSYKSVDDLTTFFKKQIQKL